MGKRSAERWRKRAFGVLVVVFATGVFAAGAISATGSFSAFKHAVSSSDTTTDTTATTTDTSPTTTDTTPTTTDTTPTTTDTTTTTTAAASTACAATGHEAISPAQASYAPGENVHITGTGFGASCNVSLRVTLPDNSTSTGAGATTADGELAFNYAIPTGPVDGTFTVDVLGDGDTVLASATFDVTSPSTGTPCAATGTEAVSTSKPSYAAGETVHITGSGFAHACNVVVRITLPDNSTATVDALTDLGGAFSTTYATPGTPASAGAFTVDVLGLADAVLANTTFETVAVVPGTATISPDKQDYVPGETVTLSGTGWQPDESVDIVINDNAGQTWMRSVNVTAATDGTITDQFNLPDWFVANYTVTATGAVSGTAVTGFNDTINFASATSAQNGSGGGNLTITKPASVANADVLVAGITIDEGSGPTITPPGGWSLISRTNNGTSIATATYYHVVSDAGAEPGSYTWTISSSARAAGGILRYTGVDTSNPIDVSLGTTGSGGNPTANQVTTSAANDVVVGFFGIDNDRTFTAPGGMTERYDVLNTDDAGPGTEAADYTQASVGPTGSKTATLNSSTDAAWTAQLVALRMASGGGGGGTPCATFQTVSSVANSSGGATSLAITKPSGVVDNDVLVAGITIDGGTGTTITPPAGWTLIDRTDNSTSMGIATYWHAVSSAAGEPASYSFTIGPSQQAAGGIMRYSGLDTSDPIDMSSENTGTGDGSNANILASGVTTSAANELVVGFFGIDNDVSFTAPSGMTERFDINNTDGSGPGIEAADYSQATAGATGDKTADAGSSGNAFATQLVAFNCAGGGGGGGGGCDGSVEFGSQTNTNNGSSSTSLTINKPASTATGDFLIAQVTFDDGTGVSTVTPPAGWTLVRRTNNADHNGQALFYKFATAGDSGTTSYAFALSSSVRAAGGILRYTGVDPTTPFDPTAASGSIGTGNVGNGTSLTANQVTTGTTNTMVIAFFGHDTNTSLSTPAGPMNERYENQNSSGTTASADDVDQAAAGATNNKTSTAGSGDDWVAQLVALRACVAGGANQPPVNTVPGTQTTNEDTAKVFSTANSNALSISDPDAGTNAVQVTLSVTNGTLTLSPLTGLSFSAGDGTADTTMTFTGTIANINSDLASSLTYNPTANFSGPAVLTITTNDQGHTGTGGALSDTDTVTINVTAVDDPPTAVNDGTTVTEDSGANTVDVLANDTDTDGGTKQVASVTQPSHGSVTNNTTNVSYTPAANYCNNPPGTTLDTFTYTLNGGSSATVTVTVTCVNDAPSCSGVSITTDENTPDSTSPSCTDPDDSVGSLTYEVTDPIKGVSSVASLHFDPNGEYEGLDTSESDTANGDFTYRAYDGTGYSTYANVAVTVNGVNDAPTCENVEITTNEDTIGTVAADCSDVDVEALTITVTQPTDGNSSYVDPNLRFDPNGEYEGLDDTESDTANGDFTYKANDGSANSNIADVAVTVNGVNDAPSCSGVSITTDENTPDSTSPSCTDPDDSVGSLTYEVTDPIKGVSSVASLHFDPNGEYEGLDTSESDTANGDFTYRAYDGTAHSTYANVAVTVNGVNDAPTCENVEITTNEDTVGTVAADCSDVDVEPLTITVTQPTDGNSSYLDPNLRFDPNGEYEGLDDTESDTANGDFTYKANDGSANSNIADVAVTVNGVNDAPSCSGVSITTDENTPDSTSPSCTDPDDSVGSLTYEVTQPTKGVSSVASLHFDPNGEYEGLDTSESDTANGDFTYRAYDGTAHSTYANVAVTVNGVNDAPVCENVEITTNEDTVGTVAADCSDVDVEPLTITVTDPIKGVSSYANPNLRFDPNGEYNSLNTGDSDTTNGDFTYKANDGSVNSNVADVAVTVTGVDDAPVLTVTPNTYNGQYSDPIDTAPASGLQPISISATDVDNTGSQLTFTIENQACAAPLALPLDLAKTELTANSAKPGSRTAKIDGRFNVTPASSPYPRCIRVSDGSAADTEPLTLTVSKEDASITDIMPTFVTIDGSDGDVDTVAFTGKFVEASDGYPSGTLSTGHTTSYNATNVKLVLAPIGAGVTGKNCTDTGVTHTGNDTGSIGCSVTDLTPDVYEIDSDILGDWFDGIGIDTLAVFDPANGFATGGGHFNWGDGPSPWTGNKVNFGFTGKNVNRNVKGSVLTVIHSAAGPYVIKTNAFTGLATAQVTGQQYWYTTMTGKATYSVPSGQNPYCSPGIQKCGGFKIIMYAEDRAEPGASADKYKLKLYAPNGTTVIFDMTLQTLAGGNVQVPHQ